MERATTAGSSHSSMAGGGRGGADGPSSARHRGRDSNVWADRGGGDESPAQQGLHANSEGSIRHWGPRGRGRGAGLQNRAQTAHTGAALDLPAISPTSQLQATRSVGSDCSAGSGGWGEG